MKRPGKRLTTSLDLSTNIPNKKEKSRFAINEITNQDFTKLIIFFNSSPYLCYKSKNIYNEPTEAYFLLIKQITMPMKSERRV